jgi:hypothetical protein
MQESENLPGANAKLRELYESTCVEYRVSPKNYEQELQQRGSYPEQWSKISERISALEQCAKVFVPEEERGLAMQQVAARSVRDITEVISKFKQVEKSVGDSIAGLQKVYDECDAVCFVLPHITVIETSIERIKGCK